MIALVGSLLENHQGLISSLLSRDGGSYYSIQDSEGTGQSAVISDREVDTVAWYETGRELSESCHASMPVSSIERFKGVVDLKQRANTPRIRYLSLRD